MVRFLNFKLKKKKLLTLTTIVMLCMVASAIGVHAQGFLEVPVKLDIEKGHIDNGVTIKVQKDGKDAFTQSGSNKIRFKLNYNMTYTLIFMKEGYITKTIEFDTHVPTTRLKAGFEPYTIGVKLYPQESETHKVVYNQAVGRIRYDKTLDEFNYDTDYSKSILSNMEDKKTAEKTAQDSSVNNAASDKSVEPEKLSAKEERRNKKKMEEEKAAEKKLALAEEKEAKKKSMGAGNEPKPYGKPMADNDPTATKKGTNGNDIKDLLASTGGAEDGSGLMNEKAADVKKPKLVNTGNDTNKPNIGDNGLEKPSIAQQKDGGDENLNRKLYSANGNAIQNDQQFDENENITREDIVEDKRVITIIKVTRRNVTTEYRRVTYRWGGLYYFQDNKLSISENVFAFYTGVKE